MQKMFVKHTLIYLIKQIGSAPRAAPESARIAIKSGNKELGAYYLVIN